MSVKLTALFLLLGRHQVPRVRLGGVGGGVRSIGRMVLAGENWSAGRNLSSVTVSTTNPTLNCLGFNPGLSSERLATNRLSHGTMSSLDVISSQFQGSGWWVGSVAGQNVEAKRKMPAHGGDRVLFARPVAHNCYWYQFCLYQLVFLLNPYICT